jgi:hypothetical protein
MADPPNGDPGGHPASSPWDAPSLPQQGSPPPSELRRITRAYKRRRNDTTTFTGTNKTPSFEFTGGGEGRGTNLDEVAWLIANLKETITQQSSIIEDVRAELTEVKTKQQNLENQNTELQEEIRSLRTQLSTYSESLPSTRTWASVAASGASRGSGVSLPQTTGTGNLEKEPNCLRISTQPKPNTTDRDDTTFTRYLPTDAANTYIRNAFLNANTTKDVQVAGVGTTKTGYVIRFRDRQSAETARTSTE